MLQRIWHHLRQPAMVVALVALVSSLTGAAAAALITGKQIKNNSITSADIRNGSLVRTDFKLSERRRLRGAIGPQGPQGPPGPSTGGAGGDLAGSYPNPSLAVRPSARVQATAPQTAPPSTLTAITFSHALWDTAGLFDPAQPDRLTIPRSGLWQVGGTVIHTAATGGSGLREVFVRVNGDAQHLVDARTGDASNAGHSVSGTLKLAAGDFLQLVFFHESGSSVATQPSPSGAASFPFLSATYLGPAG